MASRRVTNKHISVAVMAAAILAASVGAASAAQPSQISIDPQLLSSALQAFSEQSGLQVGFESELAAGLRTQGTRGAKSPAEALGALLDGTGLEFQFVNEQTVVIREKARRQTAASEGATRLLLVAQSETQDAVKGSRKAEVADEEKSEKGIPEVLVKGARSLNLDIPRDRDAPQPYVVFDSEVLERSGASNIEEFLKNRLTMNTVSATASQGFSADGNKSAINLRGLGANQTLILIDGRRMASGSYQGSPAQPDLNGIPLASIERIEVLPTTASGIYGGSATGGVVNIILKKDFSGIQTRLSYDNVFSGSAAARRVDLSAGFNLEDGKTNILISAGYSDQGTLMRHERDFVQRGRQIIRDNGGYAALESGGTPPVGSTTNIRSATGVNLTLKSGPSLGASRTYVPLGYTGTDNGNAFIANAGQYNLDLGAGASPFGGANGGLLNGPTLESANITIRREFTPRLQAFLDVGGLNNTGHYPFSYLGIGLFGVTIPSSVAANPFNQDIVVSVPVPGNGDYNVWTHDRHASAGLIAKLPGGWAGQLDHSWSRAYTYYTDGVDGSPTGLREAVIAGTLNVLRDTNAYDWNSILAPFGPPPSGYTIDAPRNTLNDTTLRFAGPVAALPAGRIMVSTLVEHRKESVSPGLIYFQPTFVQAYPRKSQSVDSAYLEARIPLVSAKNARLGIQELELQIAGRHDRYTTNGATSSVNVAATTPQPPPVFATNNVNSTDPTLALSYKPLNDLMLRASYGTGFLPPAINQLASRFVSSTGTFNDPRRGGAPTLVMAPNYVDGGNPNLQPEVSESVSVGAVVTPRFLPGFRLSIDYMHVDKEDNIATFPGGVQNLINNEALFPNRIRRGANLPGDPVGWAGPVIFVDNTLFNIARASVEAYDVQLDQNLATAAGDFNLFFAATWQPHYKTQVLATQAEVENVGISGNPLKFKANGGLTWALNRWSAGWTARYFDDYLVADPTLSANAAILRNQGNGGRIPSQLYHDVFASYRVSMAGGRAAGLLDGTEIQLGVRNVFNKRPPFEATGDFNGYYSRYADPRLASYWFSLSKNFGL